MNRACLNCNEPLTGNYCIQCGQSADTARFTIKHLFTNDFLFRVIHFDKGLFFSLKQLLTRPGHSTREYINGKRVNRTHFFSLLAILIIFFSLIEQVSPFRFASLSETNTEISNMVDDMLKKHAKITYTGIIPIYAIFSFLLFRKSKQNYAENIVISSFKTSATILFNIIFITFASFVKDIAILRIADTILAWVVTGYGTWFYYQYFSPFYVNKYLLALKSLLCNILPILLVLLVLGLITLK